MTRILRGGALTEEALRAAFATEYEMDRRPTCLAVGTPALERAALRILNPPAGSMRALTATIPNVVSDPELGNRWELREA